MFGRSMMLRACGTCVGLFAIASLSVAASAGREYSPAAVPAKPGLKCLIDTGERGTGKPIVVYTNHDGYARFHAVRPSSDTDVKLLILECADEKGNVSSYPA